MLNTVFSKQIVTAVVVLLVTIMVTVVPDLEPMEAELIDNFVWITLGLVGLVTAGGVLDFGALFTLFRAWVGRDARNPERIANALQKAIDTIEAETGQDLDDHIEKLLVSLVRDFSKGIGTTPSG